ncbi:putative quinol monooxygenase [Actibacterium sp. 188UL27-1]|uniref:putative quinol monooxygenase n=1 Tax=Actibacterium sp. 188UL27-1 TaxID=2786961 RepID=UPI00195ACFE0|nr:putative quinol monooxygenase [Actibacterium sp. 188UL27-1]MBM7069616.1 antibiotic biosynthesis monooxygenase [Actibacterium sp. 188UL27-1]
MSHHLFLFATITPKPVHMAEARQAIERIIPATRAEPGCLDFVLHESADAGCLHLYEEWVDQAALDQHYQMPYTAEVFAQYQEWLAAPVDIKKFTKIA